MKLLEKQFTYTGAKQLSCSKNWKMLSEQELNNIDIGFIDSRIGNNSTLKVWLDNEPCETT